jgi:hypothetical protein
MQRWISVAVLFASAMVGCATPYRGAHESYEGVSVRLAAASRSGHNGVELRFLTTSARPDAHVITREVGHQLIPQLWQTHQVVIGLGPDGLVRPISRSEWLAADNKKYPELKYAHRSFRGEHLYLTDDGVENVYLTTFKGPVETVWILPEFAKRLRKMFPGIRVSTGVVRVTPDVSIDAATPTSFESAPAR